MLREYLYDFDETYAYRYGFANEINVEDWAQATYVRKSFAVKSSRPCFVDGAPAGLGIATEIQLRDTLLHVLNYHGISQPKDKLDTKERVEQSQKILTWFRDKQGIKILGGDFNFLPTTKAYALFKEEGYRELIMEFAIPTSRNRLYWDNRPQKHLYSDYLFVSEALSVLHFSVPGIEVSDHLPLILEIAP